jgi:hypothetical protein
MSETRAEEIKRLQQEIADRQSKLFVLVAGDPMECVSMKGIPSYFGVPVPVQDESRTK